MLETKEGIIFNIALEVLQKTSKIARVYTVCPRSLDPFYIVSYCMRIRRSPTELNHHISY